MLNVTNGRTIMMNQNKENACDILGLPVADPGGGGGGGGTGGTCPPAKKNMLKYQP